VYFVGDLVQDANGGQYQVTATDNSTGAVTALTTLVQPSTTTTSLGTAIATTGGSGTGLTITPTAATNNALSLMPGGGTIQVGGGCITANGSVATVLGSLGPAGAHTTVQTWLVIRDSGGTPRYIPAF
jgi:hypothetical protein